MKRFFLSFCLSAAFLSCRKTGFQGPYEETRFLMDTAVRIAVYDAGLSREEAASAVHRAFGRMSVLESRVSAQADSSEMARLSRHSGEEACPVSDTVLVILRTALEVSERSGGAFDVTIGPVQDLWGFYTDHPQKPDSTDIAAVLDKVDYRMIQVGDGRVRLTRPGMKIDPGGIAKGYVVDAGVQSLMDSGVRAGIVDGGGDLRIFGSHPVNRQWRIGVRHPRPDENSLFGVLSLDGCAVATSGDYERFFMHGRMRCHHILDPQTGYPANGCISVTVTADLAMQADAYATAVFVLGPEKGMQLLESHPGLEGLILYEKEGRVLCRVSSGMRKAFSRL
ncbi:FAD:protein FMN transferase [bacterium]|nr:FAD:protein FMN transferase [bacterium]